MKAIVAGSFLLIGYILGILTWGLPEYEWSYKVDAVDLAVIFIGGLAVVVLQSRSNWQQTAGRNARQLLIDQLQRITLHMDRIRSRYTLCVSNKPDSEDIQVILSDIRGLSNMIQRIRTSVGACELKLNEIELDDLECRYLHFKRSLTGKGYPHIALSSAEFVLAENAHTHLIDRLVMLQIEVNNS